MTKQEIIKAEYQGIVSINGGEVWTDSLLIADKFSKRHDVVLRAARNLECSAEFRRHNFAESSYLNEQGKEQPMVRVSESGFMMLAMGFTGKAAMEWKERFIKAFKDMRAELNRIALQKQSADWQAIRSKGKVVRIGLTDVIQEFIEYATAQGSQSASMYYMNISKMENKALFLIDSACKTNFRDRLTAAQVGFLITAETIAQRALREGMAQKLFYKDIYQLAKQRVESFAAIAGKSIPGDDRLLLAQA